MKVIQTNYSVYSVTADASLDNSLYPYYRLFPPPAMAVEGSYADNCLSSSISSLAIRL